tara:strand:+ start:3657 stop:4568 length:912 start_codon:yes stop_codon:yes gene_type:complete
MANYSFLKEAEVYIVSGTTKLQIDISSITFNQTFTEQSRPVKTLHNQSDWFEASVINFANPANFELKTNLLIEDDTRITFDRMLAGGGFDLYIKTAADVFKLDDCVITNGQINIERLRPLSLTVSGEASKLLTGQSDEFDAISGMVLRTPASPRTYNLSPELTVLLDGADISSDLRSLSMELQHEVKWTNHKTVNNAIAGTMQYPSGFKYGNKILAGNITRYSTDTNNTVAQSFGLDKPLRIKAGTTIGGTFYGIDLNTGDTNGCSFTNRVNTQDVFTQSTDWRMTRQTGGNIASVLIYTTQS